MKFTFGKISVKLDLDNTFSLKVDFYFIREEIYYAKIKAELKILRTSMYYAGKILNFEIRFFLNFKYSYSILIYAIYQISLLMEFVNNLWIIFFQ